MEKEERDCLGIARTKEELLNMLTEELVDGTVARCHCLKCHRVLEVSEEIFRMFASKAPAENPISSKNFFPCFYFTITYCNSGEKGKEEEKLVIGIKELTWLMKPGDIKNLLN
jgi:hypothetical protein